MDDRSITEADMHCGLTGDPVERTVECFETVLARLLRLRLHVRLVDLHDVGTRGEKIADLFVDRDSVGHRGRLFGRIVVVLRLLSHREGTGHGHLDRLRCMRAQELHVVDFDRPLPPDRTNDARHYIRTPGAARDGPGVLDVEPLQRGREAIRVAFAADLAVGDDVEAGPLLRFDGKNRGIVLRLCQERLRDAPQLLRAHPRRQALLEPLSVDEPLGLRVTADERGREQHDCCYQSLRSSRSFTNTVFGSGSSGRSGNASRSLAMTVGLRRRKKVLISFSSARVVTIARLGS